MMLIGVSLGVLTLAGAAAHSTRSHVPHTSAKSKADPSPAIPVIVDAAPDVSRSLIARALAEADAIWRPLGISLLWHVADSPSTRDDGQTLRVIVDDEPGGASGGDLSLGWITFPEPGRPEPIIHLSRANAFHMMMGAPQVRQAAPAEWQQILLGRALGRALAHELGHYLLASAAHTGHGLMRSPRTAESFFTSKPADVNLDQEQLAILAAHTGPRH